MMFNVEKYTVDQATGFTDISLNFDLGKGVVNDSRRFQRKEAADFYIYGSKKAYIILKFENYVKHKRKLHANGDKMFYNTVSRLKSLEYLYSYVKYFQNEPLKDICRYMLLLEKHLQNVLPSPNNDSYISSKDAVNEMVTFCRLEMEKYNQAN